MTKNPLDPLKHTFYYFRQNDVIHEETPEQVGPLTFCPAAVQLQHRYLELLL